MGRIIFPVPGSFKSVQRGVILISGAVSTGTATLIPAVDTTKAELRMLGCTSDNSAFTLSANVVLTNSTTVTANRSVSNGTTNASWELTEVH